jgi:peptidoglycan/xylan/chitin deacetylase (PgdA/CDA1 family)
LLVLTFHSISAEPGPTSIRPETFRMQMDVLSECGFRSVTCQDFLDWHHGKPPGSARQALITFDDGFADFATTAFPILRDHGYSAIVFVPTGKLGAREDWRGSNEPSRALMSWKTIEELEASGVEFGGHGVTHADLTRLSAEERRNEIDGCARELGARIGRPVRAFAAPYGNVNRAVLEDVARTYKVAFGTRFDRARPTDDRFDVPRIEMHYFRGRRQWEGFVRGDNAYFLARRVLRAGRAVATKWLNLGSAE